MDNVLNNPDSVSSANVGTIDPSVMEARYEKAQSLIQGIWTKEIAFNTTLFPVWIGESDCFWYERQSREGREYRLVNANAETNNIAFDHKALAMSLTDITEQEIDPNDLPINQVEIALDANACVNTVCFTALDKSWQFEIATSTCTAIETLSDQEIISPNGRQVAFLQDFNIWVRDLETKKERALTQDGEEEYAYGALAAPWGNYVCKETPQLRWSPDSSQVYTVQRDIRNVKTLPIVSHIPLDGSFRPTVDNRKIAYPGDEHVEEFRLLTIDVKTGQHQSVNYGKIPVTRNSHGFFDAKLGWWGADSRRAYFVDIARGYKTVRVVEFDTYTGVAKVLFEETSDTHFSLMLNNDDLPTFLPVPESNELIWFSEHTGWAHLYLYDLETGKLKHPITSGNWLVRHIVYFDPKLREVFAQTAGREIFNDAGEKLERDPYYRDLVRINIDTGEMVTLISSDHEYIAVTQTDLMTMMAQGYDCHTSNAISNSGNFAVVTRSRADQVPVSLLIDRHGKEVLVLETADISALPEGWQWPEPVKLKADDNLTDIYGLVYRPSNFSSDKSYPIVSYVFNVPEFNLVPKGSFTNELGFGWTYLEAAAVAELGFIVVLFDGRGTPFRDKAFLDESYGCLENASKLEDHIAGIHQLAGCYPYMDLTRVGIYTTMGGPGPVQSLLQYPNFYKVAVAATPHDSRLIAATHWGEKYEGLSGPEPDYQYPEDYINRFQGKLLLMAGMLDNQIPPAITFRLVEALQRANKDFDLLLFPNLGHFVCNYMIRRGWDYLVRHLMGVEPPKEFKLISAFGGD